ncbi:MAG TPA: sigma-70 family RNA polymerase sigma factor [Polyangia bacterium]
MGTDVGGQLRALYQAGRTRWPAFEVPYLRFVAQVIGAADASNGVVADEVHAADVYLACGCLLGDGKAIAAFEADIIAPLAEQLARRRDLRVADDIIQELRTRLLVPQANSQRRLSAYRGRGPLPRWVKVAAHRVAVDLFRAQRPESEQSILDYVATTQALTDEHDPEVDLLERHSRRAFESALADALSSMAARDATVLRLFYLEKLPLARIAARFGVSQRSIQNWIVRARKHARLQTRAGLAERFRLPGPTLEDLGAVAQFSVDLNLRQILDRTDAAHVQPRPES